MKELSKSSTQIFLAIISLLNEEGNIQISNEDTYMPLFVEKINVLNEGTEEELQEISLAHYGKQNGDLMADPEMIFIYRPASEAVIPFYFKQDYMGFEEYSLQFDEKGEVIGCLDAIQEGQADFAEMWLENIKEQQNLVI
ncbi:MAG: hypothetical protein GY705_09550 [Bacteroidetes bacterium]|nr:hypothetical protein [Bacteroidota bacterium]